MYRGRLNDALTHVEHCGPALRDPANDRLDALTQALPESFMGVPVEYDVMYEGPAGVIGGYRYTDFLTSCIGLYPCNSGITVSTLCGLAHCEVLPIGRVCVEALREGLQDKYRLRANSMRPELLVVLPGSNMLRRHAVDWAEVSKAVEAGAYIKPHPLTSGPELYQMAGQYGDRVLPRDAALYPMLASCKDVYFTSASETGLAAILLGKMAHVIDGHCEIRPNFQSLYRALGQTITGRSMQDKLAALLSYPQSGIFTLHHAVNVDMEQWVNRFFAYNQRFVHGRNGSYTTADALA